MWHCHLSRGATGAVQGAGTVLAQCWHCHCPGTRRQPPLPAWHELPAELCWAQSSLRHLINPDLQAQAAAQGPPNRLPRLLCPRGGHAELFRSAREGSRSCRSDVAVSQLHCRHCGCQQSARHSSLTHQRGPAWHCPEPCCPAVTHTRCHMSPLPAKPQGTRGSQCRVELPLHPLPQYRC